MRLRSKNQVRAMAGCLAAGHRHKSQAPTCLFTFHCVQGPVVAPMRSTPIAIIHQSQFGASLPPRIWGAIADPNLLMPCARKSTLRAFIGLAQDTQTLTKPAQKYFSSASALRNACQLNLSAPVLVRRGLKGSGKHHVACQSLMSPLPHFMMRIQN